MNDEGSQKFAKGGTRRTAAAAACVLAVALAHRQWERWNEKPTLFYANV